MDRPQPETAPEIAGEAGQELLARMQELAQLQRQLEGLRRATSQRQTTGQGSEPAGEQASPAPGAGSVVAGLRGALAARLSRRAAATAAPAAAQEDNGDDVHPHATLFQSRRANSGQGEQRGTAPGFILQLLETAMLEEALRRSGEGDAASRAAEEAAAAEARAAEALARCSRVPWSRALKDGDDGECALCLDEYKEGEEVLKTPCGHVFHEECLKPWFLKSTVCPLCQREV